MQDPLKTISENYENLLNLNYEKSLDAYLFIQKTFNKGSIANNEGFKQVYKNFYRLNRAGLTNEWKELYFEILDSKEKNLEKILNELYEIPNHKKQNSIQFSFATKLIHTIDTTKPIFDSLVGAMLEQKVKGRTKEEKIQSCIKIYKVLQNVSQTCLKDRDLQKILKAFRIKFGVSEKRELSDEKIFDFLLWGLGKIKKR